MNEDDFSDKDLALAWKYLTERYVSIQNLVDKFPASTDQSELTKFKLVLTDLFVEKDIQILSRRATEHTRQGDRYFVWSVILFSVGTAIAVSMMAVQYFDQNVEILEWSQLVQLFFKQFTAYGFLVLTALALWKQSKARLDQAERLRTKRRTDRILRLLIYLRDGDVDSTDVERIIKLGFYNDNAFMEMVAEGRSPLSGLISEALTAQQTALKDTVKSVSGKSKT